MLAEICHIRARRKGGARYDANLTAQEKDEFQNLILLCPTCHTLVDKDKVTFTVDTLIDIKTHSERGGGIELTPALSRQAMLIIEKTGSAKAVGANAKSMGIAVAVGGDVNAPITINSPQHSKNKDQKYPANSIGADANMTNYIEYLCGLYVDYMSQIETADQSWGKLGRHIKTKFRLKKRTRNHLSAERFNDLVDYLVVEKLSKTPVGKKHLRAGTRLCRTFEEFRFGKM